MKLKISPFKGLEAAERELKRTELYQDIAKQLKLESYDASPIGHSFVAQYEKQLPGIITAVAGDHSFLNGDDETNRRIIMEAVDSGLALKAGLIAAVLMIIYKIIRVITNNKSFGGGSGGGRGSVPYVTDQQQQLVAVATDLQESLSQAQDSLTIVASNAAARDETSSQYAAAEQVSSAYRVYVQGPDGIAVQDEPQKPKVEDDPFKLIKDMNISAIGFASLPAFMVSKNQKDFTGVLTAVNTTLKALKVYDPAKLSDMVEQVSSKLSRPEDSEFLLSQNYNNMVTELVNRISDALGLGKPSNPAALPKLEISPTLKETYEALIRTSYGELLEEKSQAAMTIPEFVKDFIEEDGEFAQRSMFLAEFNSSFAEFLGDNKELEDSRYYSGLQHYATTLSEYKQMIKQSAGVTNKDEIIKRLDLLISIIEVYTKFLLATICMFRKEADKVDQFRENNIEKMQKLSKALKDFANSARGETT